jgi:hypothetical protein
MAKKPKPKSKPKAKAAKTKARPAPERRVPSEKVVEMGEWEQGQERVGPRQAGSGEQQREFARERARQGERYGGIPIGSDPRE